MLENYNSRNILKKNENQTREDSNKLKMNVN